MKKYELTEEVKEVNGVRVYRIKALIDFANVEVGDLGGFVESEENLFHEGNAWVYGDAKVFGNARVFGDARVYDSAYVFGNAWVYGDAKVYDDAHIYCYAQVYGNARVFDDTEVCECAEISNITDILVIYPIGSRNSRTTFFKVKPSSIYVKCGCFTGDIDTFEKQVEETYKGNKYEKQYKLAIELAKSVIGIDNKEK